MNELKFEVLNYLNHFGLYDYIAYIWLFLTFFILLILALILIKKSTKISIILILFSLILFFIGPPALKYFLDTAIRPVKISKTSFKKLNFSNTLIVDTKIKNISKNTYSECQINTKVYKQGKTKIKNFINKLKPITHRTILSKEKLKPGESMDSRIIFYNFTYNNDINISLSAECY